MIGIGSIWALGASGYAQGFFGGGSGRREVALVDRFDADGNGRLDAAERREARDAVGVGRQRRGRQAAQVRTGAALSPGDVTAYPDRDFYDPGVVRTLFLTFESDDWESELEAFYNTDVEVSATLVVDGETYPDVGVHFRGNSSYRQIPTGYKRSLNLKVDWVHERADIDGYQTFNLLNSHEDPTYIRTVLFNEIARQYIAAPKANFVRVVINGEDWGIYVNAQQFNGDFVREWFDTRDGVRWKVPGSPRSNGGLEYFGESQASYRRVFELDTVDQPKAWTDLIQLTRILNQTPPAQLGSALGPILDIDDVLWFIALDAVFVNGDGYWVRNSDYHLYQDVNGRFHPIPHDTNETFNGLQRGAGFGGRRGGVTLDPLDGLTDDTKPLRSRLLAVPAFRDQYLDNVATLVERNLDWNVLGTIATDYQILIAEVVANDVHRLDGFADFPADSAALGSFRSFVEGRHAYLTDYLAERR